MSLVNDLQGDIENLTTELESAKEERDESNRVAADFGTLCVQRLGALEIERAAHEKTKAALAAMTNVAVSRMSAETYVQLNADLDAARARAEKLGDALRRVRDEQVAEGEQFSAAHFRVRAIAAEALADTEVKP